tara:strand:+ start:331 stop:576 length:246 start_codon:yes stop_codon:yes gene_type:complete
MKLEINGIINMEDKKEGKSFALICLNSIRSTLEMLTETNGVTSIKKILKIDNIPYDSGLNCSVKKGTNKNGIEALIRELTP